MWGRHDDDGARDADEDDNDDEDNEEDEEEDVSDVPSYEPGGVEASSGCTDDIGSLNSGQSRKLNSSNSSSSSSSSSELLDQSQQQRQRTIEKQSEAVVAGLVRASEVRRVAADVRVSRLAAEGACLAMI